MFVLENTRGPIKSDLCPASTALEHCGDLKCPENHPEQTALNCPNENSLHFRKPPRRLLTEANPNNAYVPDTKHQRILKEKGPLSAP